MTTPVSARSIMSGPEVEEAIRSISDAGWHRLRRVARHYSFGRLDADDLLYEALSRTLDGRRTCPAGVDVVRVLAEAIRSIASSSFKAAARHPELQAVVDDVEVEERDDTDRQGENPEQKMISDQEADRIRSAIVSLFNDDENAQIIVEGEMDGMSREELCGLTGLHGQAYDSKRRLIRRRINGAFPEGWIS
jgi:DNA-directed RNA polymerase specialized sigma24 family protein